MEFLPFNKINWQIQYLQNSDLFFLLRFFLFDVFFSFIVNFFIQGLNFIVVFHNVIITTGKFWSQKGDLRLKNTFLEVLYNYVMKLKTSLPMG